MELHELYRLFQRLLDGSAQENERQELLDGWMKKQFTFAMGEGSVAIGGAVTDTIIVTGSGNIILHNANPELVVALLENRTFSTAIESEVAEQRKPKKKKIDSSPSNHIPVIAIIGMGFAGITTAIRLMQLASVPIKLVLFEQKPVQEYGGLAYGASNLLRDHYLNIHAGRISIYRERPDDFLKWATEDANRDEWFEKLGIPAGEKEKWDRNLAFTEFSAVPRLIYQLYLRDRFKESVDLAKETVTIVQHLGAYVYDLDDQINTTRLYYTGSEGGQHRLDVDVAVMCTGHTGPLLPSVTLAVQDHPAFFAQPYVPSYSDALIHANSNDKLLIIGSGLSAYDAAVSAVSCGFRGRTKMCSRNGRQHAQYPMNHSHTILPPIFEADFVSVQTAEEMISTLEQAIEKAKTQIFPAYFPHEHPAVIPERVLKAVEPQIARFVQKSSKEEVRKLLLHRSWFVTMRTSVVPVVTQLVLRSNVSITAKEIHSVEKKFNDLFTVKFKDEAGQLTSEDFTMIVCCAGYDPDYLNAKGLWRKIMDKVAIPHEKTGLGIEVGDNGRVKRKVDGSLSRSLYAVGPMRQGDEIQRRGRIGAFTFSIGTIRNQALMAALSILKTIELPAFRQLGDAGRRRYHRQIEDLLGQTGPKRREFNALVSHIADAQFLANTQRRDDWIDRIRHEIYGLIDLTGVRDTDKPLMLHELWHYARMQAGYRVTDIRRLSERYAIVRSYRPGSEHLCIAEKKECKDQLKKMMTLLGASSVSLSVYFHEARCLYPFVDHLRLNRFTPTPYGENVAGRLVKAYTEQVDNRRLFSEEAFFRPKEIEPVYLQDERLVGLIIPDYNEMSMKKPVYESFPRLYPHLLVALVLVEGAVVGTIYFEAPKERKFEPTDIHRMLRQMGDIPARLSKVVSTWVPKEDPDQQDQDLRGMKKEPGTDMRYFNFANAILEDATMNRVQLDSAVLNGARCHGAKFEKALMRRVQMIGTEFVNAYLNEADMSGSVMIGTDFAEADLRMCKIDGSIVERTRFNNADLSDAQILGTTMRGVDLSGASLRGARLVTVTFEDCRWEHADLTNCTLDQTTYQNLPEDIANAFRASFTGLTEELTIEAEG